MIICPIDRRPCDPACPDRYVDQEGGGCFITTAQELEIPVFLVENEEDIQLISAL